MGQLTDKTHIILMTGDIRIWITEKEFETAEKLIGAGKVFINLDGRLINTKSIIYAGPRNELELADRIKRGEWKCEYGFWHEKYQQCGHGDEAKYKNINH